MKRREGNENNTKKRGSEKSEKGEEEYHPAEYDYRYTSFVFRIKKTIIFAT